MYAEFFGLAELPFNNTPDPRYFYPTPDHEEALASLIYAVNGRKGFVLLTGEVGTGKTLVSRMMLRHFGTQVAFANINHATKGPEDLMESVLAEFELPYAPHTSNAHMVRTLHDFLLDKFAQNTAVVLVLDEAQSLSVEAFEQLRMMGNLEADDAKLLQIAILGQPELRQTFQKAQLRQLRQRIFRTFHLPSLDRELTEGYIRHRLTVGGAGKRDLFTPCAFDRIFQHSQGLPRLINTICDNTLLSAYSADRGTIDGEFVDSTFAAMMTIGESQVESEAAVRGGPGAPEGQLGGTAGQEVDRVPEGQVCAESSMDGTECDRPAPRPSSGEPAPTPPAREPGAPPQIMEQFTTFKRSISSAVQDCVRRIELLEREETETRAACTEIINVKEDLRGLASESREMLQQAREIADGLEEREQHVKRLHDLFRGILNESKAIIQRVGRASQRSERIEQQIKQAHGRLIAQSQRTGRLTAVLRRVLDRAEQNFVNLAEAGEMQKDMSAPVLEIVPDNEETPHRQRAARLERLLTSSRESLFDVRSLISEANAACAAEAADADPQDSEVSPSGDTSAGRLVEQVQSLLQLIEAERSSDPVTSAQTK
jgi:type II secretory pathway predicted ATPase ExeA